MLKRWLAAGVVVIALCGAAPAFAQSTVLQSGSNTAGHVPQYSGQGAAQPVIMDGGGSGGGANGVNPGELGIISRDPNNHYPSASSGHGPAGEHICFYDAPTNNATGYHYLCFDPNAAGGGLIDYGVGGSASTLPLTIKANGISQTFPLSGGSITGTPNTLAIFGGGGALASSTYVPSINFPALGGQLTNSAGSTSVNLAAGAAAANLGFTPLNPTTAQSANQIYAGPASGSAAAPTFRALTQDDLPTVSYVATDPRFGTSLCSGVACPIGTGGDDSVPLNAITSACQSAGSCEVVIPNGVTLHVCSASWSMPATAPFSVTIRGGAVVTLPGCATPPHTVIDMPSITFTSPYVQTSAKLDLENTVIDGYCLSNHDVVVEYQSVAAPMSLIAHGTRFRNVAPSLSGASIDGGSNIFIATGFQDSLDASNIAENVNDPGHTCYGTYTAGSTANLGLIPPYLVDVYGGDNNIGIGGAGASIAGIVARYGASNHFRSAHPWGYPATNASLQPYSEQLYNFITRGEEDIANSEFDNAASAGLRVQAVPGTSQVDTVTSVTVAGSGGTPGATTVLTGTTGTGTKWTGIGIIGPTGALAAIPWVTYGGNYSVNPTLSGDPVTATNGLTGVTVTLAMGTYASPDTSGPMLTGNVGYGAPDFMSIGTGVASVTGAANISLSTTCVVLDSGATLPAAWGFDRSTNLGCNATVPYGNPTNVGTCPIYDQITSYDLAHVAGTFQANANCSGGTYVLSFASLMPPAKSGFTCSTALAAASGSFVQTNWTNASATFTATDVANNYLSFSCSAF